MKKAIMLSFLAFMLTCSYSIAHSGDKENKLKNRSSVSVVTVVPRWERQQKRRQHWKEKYMAREIRKAKTCDKPARFGKPSTGCDKPVSKCDKPVSSVEGQTSGSC